MGCRICSEVYEGKYVSYNDAQQIKMFIKRNGAVKMVHNDAIEMTNFNYCPYCGDKLDTKSKCKKIDSDGMFEMLGYKKRESNTDIFYTKPMDFEEYNIKFIKFYSTYKKVGIDSDVYSVQEIQAIYKKCQELGYMEGD